MRLLIVDPDSDSLYLALRAAAQGHEVKLFSSAPEPVGRGFENVERIGNWIPEMRWAELVYSSSRNAYVQRLESFRLKGFPVYSVSSMVSELTAAELFSDKVQVFSFESLEEAKWNLQNSRSAYVVNGSFRRNAADALSFIRSNELSSGSVVEVPPGVVFRVTRFMGAKGWIGPWINSFSDIFLFSADSPVGEQYLGEMEKYLVEAQHLGPVSVMFVLSEGEVRPIHFDCKLPMPIFPSVLNRLSKSIPDWLLASLDGKDITEYSPECGCSVVLLSMNGENSPIYGVTRGTIVHAHGIHVQLKEHPIINREGELVEHPIWSSAGSLAAVVSGSGASIKQTIHRARTTAAKIFSDGMFMSDTAFTELRDKLEKLHSAGLFEECHYG